MPPIPAGDSRGNAGALYFCPADMTPFPAADLYSAIERRFRGSRALLFADCCFSGFLALEAPRRAGRVSYGVLTSQMATQTSTGLWSFTESLIAAFGQQLCVDASGDGALTFAELAAYAEARLAKEAGQLSMFLTANDFPTTYVLGFVPSHGAGAAHAALPSLSAAVYAPGSRVRVKDPSRSDGDSASGSAPSRGATVLAVRRKLHLVRVDGTGEIDDTWVGPDAILGLLEPAPAAAAATGHAGGKGAARGGSAAAVGGAGALGGKGEYSVGDRVKTTWFDRAAWPGLYPGTVASARCVVYHLRYEDGSEAQVAHEHTRPVGGAAGSRTAAAAAPLYPAGTPVEGLWQSGEKGTAADFYSAKVVASGPGFRVRYDDGNVGLVLASSVKAADGSRGASASGSAGLGVGSKVLARWSLVVAGGDSFPDWYPGRIDAVFPALHHVRYNDDGSEDTLAPQGIKLIGAAASGLVSSSGDPSLGADGFWRIGASVEALWDEGRKVEYPGYFKAVVRSVDSGYRVKYDDGTLAFAATSAMMLLPPGEEEEADADE